MNCKKILIVLFVSSMIFAGCNLFGKDDSTPTSSTPSGGNNTGTGNATASDQNEIDQVLSNDDLFNQEMSDMMDENDVSPVSSENLSLISSPLLVDTTLPKAVYPAGWRRQRTGLAGINKNYALAKNGDTSYCTVTVTRNVTGKLWVDTTKDAIINPGSKTFADTISNKWVFEKSTGKGWHLTKISPREMKLTDTPLQKVFIDKIQVVVNGQTVLEVTSPEQMISIENLPVFPKGSQVKVMAAVRNISPAYNPDCFVFLHHISAYGMNVRLRMWDDGDSGGDAAANDGVFTWTGYVGGALRHYAVIDVLDSKCLQNQTEDDYNSNAWGLPYRVK